MKIAGIDIQLDKEMRRGMAKMIILSYVRHNKTYPYAVLKFLRSVKLMHGQKEFEEYTKSDVYNIIATLEKDGYITSKAQMKGNKVEKVLTITKKGENVVKNKDMIFMGMIQQMKKLIKEEFYVKGHTRSM